MTLSRIEEDLEFKKHASRLFSGLALRSFDHFL